MTCKKCKWEFCWVCMGPWSEHGTAWYNCSRYEEKADTSKDAQSKSRAQLERYLHVSLTLSGFSSLLLHAWPAACAISPGHSRSLLMYRAHSSTVLQPVREPRAEHQARSRLVRPDREEDGRAAGAVDPVVDRGPVPRQGGRDARAGPDGPQVDLCDGVLPREEQPDADV